MKILSLDLGTSTGWAFKDTTLGIVKSGTVWNGEVSKKGTQKSGGEAIQKIVRFDAWIDVTIAESKPDRIIVENSKSVRGLSAIHLFEGFLWCVLRYAYHYKIPVVEYTPTEWKKAVLGSGNADKGKNDKPEARKAAERIYGIVPTSGDEADALCLLAYYEKISV